ncbi:hypothetical protein OKW43_000036 [Paraburkholderia sp. WC7.3g]|uniref:hypothetical protein n=1 Tax=Paraburkholderia sp. WC7.3g TaxID=2991070 RepID=UPI003D208A5F
MISRLPGGFFIPAAMLKRLLATLLLFASLPAFAQFTPGQILTAAQLNSALSAKLPIAGGTLTGPLTVPSLSVTGSPIPQASGGTGATSISAPGGAFDTLCSSTIGQLWVRATGGWGCTALGFVSPVWWGADPTGVALSTSAFNSAITAAQSAGSQSGVVSVPVGKFLVSGITVSAANLSFIGAGAPGVNSGPTIVAASTSADVFTITAPYVNFQHLSFYSPTPMTAGAFLNYQSGSTLSYLENVYMVNGYNPLMINAAGAIHAHVLEIRDFNGKGITINGSGDQYLDGVIIDMDSGSYTPQAGIAVSNSNGSITITNSDILHAHHNLLINPGSGQAVKWLYIDDSYFDSCDWTYSSSTGNGINVAPTGTGSVLGLMISNSWTATCNNGIYLGGLSTTTIDGVHLSNVMSVNNVQDGLYATYANHINLSNVAVAGNSNVTTGTYSGLEFGTGANNITITGGVIGVTAGFASQQKYNVQFDSGFTGAAYLSNVNLLGATSASISNGNARNNTVNVANAAGYNSQGPAGISLGASPYTYNSTFMGPLMVSMYGGTLSSVTVGGVQVCNATPCTFEIPSQGSFIATYSSAPSVAIFLP